MQNDGYQTKANKYIFNTYNRYPITLIRGQGAYVWDSNNKKYLDFLTGIACTPLGHAHPAILNAITEQAQKIAHTSNLYYSPPSIDLAEFLVNHSGLDQVFFCNSGAEANETAIKLARKYQWRQGNKNKHVILSAQHCFHGRTLGALAATAKTKLHEGFAPLPQGFRYQSWDDVETFCDAINDEVAAVILEPIQGEGGIRIPPENLLTAVRAACDKAGALLIFDEVQCGIGRSGKLFAYQYSNVKPDVLTLAKGIANGLPLGAVCARNEAANAFLPGDHGSTFGGNPISCSAALATLKIIATEQFLQQINQLGNYLVENLTQLQHHYPHKIGSIRGMGLMVGIELLQNPQAVLTQCQRLGLLVNITADHVLRLLPPYIITKTDIDAAISFIAEALNDEHETKIATVHPEEARSAVSKG